MNRIYLIVLIALISLTSCSFPSEDDKENITALTDIYAHAFEKGDKKSLYYVLDEKFPRKTDTVKQLEYRSLYLKDVTFRKTNFLITDASFIHKTASGVMTYNVSYTKKGDSLPTVKQGNKKEMVFIKGKQSWKILSMTSVKGSGTTVDKQLLHALYQALDTRISALNNKDMELFSTVLSPKLPNKNAIIEDLKKSVTAFKDIVYILVARHPVEISDTKATVVQNYEMRLTLPDGSQQKLPAMAEKLTLEPNSSGVWQIVGGLK